jgi:hypothetical protein
MLRSFEEAPLWLFNCASLEQAAQAYARCGLAVFPLEPRGKRPLTAHGLYSATTRSELIHDWWTRWPQANIGLPCLRWWVLDIDPRHGGMDSLKLLQQELAPAALKTRIQLTGGGGAHLLYRARPDRADAQLTNTTKFAGLVGLDLRVKGGYIVVAPSVHPLGGVYQWQNTLPLQPFPDALIERWRASRRRSSAFNASSRAQSDQFIRRTPHNHADRAPSCGHPPCYLNYAVKQARETWGRRHNFALYLAHRLIDDIGMDSRQAEGWMCEYTVQVRDAGYEPFDEAEALDCLSYVIREAQAA